MPTYQVQQTWRAKRPKTVVSHDLENPPQPPKNEFAEGCRKSNSILKLEHFFKPCFLWEYKMPSVLCLLDLLAPCSLSLNRV